MDEAGVRAIVDLDGRWGDRLRAELARYQEPYPDRFAVFSGIDYDNFATDPSFGETEAKRLRESVALGARGLKVWKTARAAPARYRGEAHPGRRSSARSALGDGRRSSTCRS